MCERVLCVLYSTCTRIAEKRLSISSVSGIGERSADETSESGGMYLPDAAFPMIVEASEARVCKDLRILG